MKKYKFEIVLLVIIFVILYCFPINIYLTSDFLHADLSNLLYIINPFTYFICSIIEARHSNNFYIFPIIISCLFIPLAFTIYKSSYLSLFFLYLGIALIGGLFGYWCKNNDEARKSLKKALGIMCIIAGIFTFLATVISYIFKYYEVGSLNFKNIFNLINIETYIFIIICFILGRYCLRKKKKE